MSRPDRLRIVDSTLREGEQTAGVSLSPGRRLEVALALDDFGADYIELTTPVASRGHLDSCRAIAAAVRKSRVLTHIRCRREDAIVAMDTGVSGLNLFICTSRVLRAASGLGSLNDVMSRAADTLSFIKHRAPHLELRLSMEDAFRTPLEDIVLMAGELDSIGVLNRIGLADTTGGATPMQVAGAVSAVRAVTALGIEFHAHNDTGCATANSHAAFMSGAAYIDVSVLGLGERNGITPLAELMARLHVSVPTAIRGRYGLDKLLPLHKVVADAFGVEIPANHCIVGQKAFTHRAGVHISALRNNPVSYEVVNPAEFGRNRELDTNSSIAGHRLAKKQNA